MKRKILWLLAVVTVAVLLLDGVILVNRYDIFASRRLSREALYLPADQMRIVGFSADWRQGTLEIHLHPPQGRRWTISGDAFPAQELTAPHPRFKPLEGTHRYRIQSQDSGAEFSITLVKRQKADYLPFGSGFGGHFERLASSIPVGALPVIPEGAFTDLGRPEKEIRAARAYLAQEAGLDTADSDAAKVEKIAAFLLRHLDGRRGIPSTLLERQSPIRQFEMIKADEGWAWCGTFANIYRFFANAAGLPTRTVSASGVLDGVTLNGHVFNETWLADQKRWAFVDLTSSKAMVINGRGEALSTLDLHNLINLGIDGGATAVHFQDGRLARVPYGQVNDSERLYFKEDVLYFYHLTRDHTLFLSPLERLLSMKTLLFFSQGHPPLFYSVERLHLEDSQGRLPEKIFVKKALLLGGAGLLIFWSLFLPWILLARWRRTGSAGGA